MSILNVVQPDELDGQSFELINDKLEVRISGRRNNGLELKDDGLFTPGNSDKGVPNRFVYLVGNGASTIVHKNVTFDLRVIDGGLNGTLRSPALQYNDTITYDDGSIWSKDITDQIELKWGLESCTRIIFRFHNGNEVPSLWVLRIHRAGFGGSSLLIIDEMTNTGNQEKYHQKFLRNHQRNLRWKIQLLK